MLPSTKFFTDEGSATYGIVTDVLINYMQLKYINTTVHATIFSMLCQRFCKQQPKY